MSTLAGLRAELAEILGLDTSDPTELELMDLWLNEGVTDVVRRTRCKVLPATVTLTANEGDYTLDTDILMIIDMYLTQGTSNYPLERVTPAELLNYRRSYGSTNQSGTSRVFAMDGGNLFMVYPAPQSADTVSFIYVPRPVQLEADDDVPSEIPEEFHKLIVFYARIRGADYDDDTSSDQGQRYQQEYEIAIREMMRALNLKGGKLPRIRVNWRRREIMPSDPSRSYH